MLACTIAALAMAAASTILAGEPAKSAAPLNQLALNHAAASEAVGGSVAVLIEKLGDDRFEAREEATRRLSQMGIEIEPALQTALHDPDPEVRVRAHRVLTTILTSDLERRLNAFAEDVNDVHHYDLPGWSRYRKLVGDDKVARGLFVEMQRAEPNLFRELEDGPAAAQQALEIRIGEIAASFARQISRRRYSEANGASLGTAAAILFIGSDGQLNIGEQLGIELNSIFTTSPGFTSAINGGTQSKPLHKLLGAWVSRDCPSSVMGQNLWLALQYELKEAVPTAAKALLQGNQPQYVSLAALSLISTFGDISRLPAVEASFKDATVYWQGQIKGRNYQTQIRDVALVIAIRLRKQDPKHFGFPRFESSNSSAYYNWNSSAMSFANDSDRAAAMKKWTDWTAKHPLPANASKSAAKS